MLDDRERRRVDEIAARLALGGDHGARDAELLADLLRVEQDYQRLVARYGDATARLTEIRKVLDCPTEDDRSGSDGTETARGGH